MPLLDLSPGTGFEARARAFGDFELRSGAFLILRLQYAHDVEVETLGGTALRCDQGFERWSLQFFRTPYFQRESYRLLRAGEPVVSTGVLRPFRSSDITYSDGTVWRCHVGLFVTHLTDAAGNRVLQVVRRSGPIFGVSKLQITFSADHSRLLPLLIILLHFTTHTSQ